MADAERDDVPGASPVGEPSGAAATRPVGDRDASRHPRGRRSAPTWLVIAVALLISLLVRVFLLGVYSIPSGSMEATLDLGDRVAVAKWRGGDVQRGDVVVFDGATTWGPVTNASPGPLEAAVGAAEGHDPADVYVKRVIGVGGDHVACCDAQGRVTVNDEPIDEPYLYPGDVPSLTTFDVQVPAGRVWLMGDHRSNSADSRSHLGSPGGGTVSVDDVIGPVIFRYWPLTRIGSLG